MRSKRRVLPSVPCTSQEIFTRIYLMDDICKVSLRTMCQADLFNGFDLKEATQFYSLILAELYLPREPQSSTSPPHPQSPTCPPHQPQQVILIFPLGYFQSGVQLDLACCVYTLWAMGLGWWLTGQNSSVSAFLQTVFEKC